MKKLSLIVLSGILGLVFLGCASHGISKDAKESVGWKNAPKWVIMGYDGDYSAVGSAPIVNKNVQFARTEAMTSARGELIKRIESAVSANLTKEGIRDDDTLRENVRNLVVESAQRNMQGVALEDTWIDDDGINLYVLVRLSKDSISALEKNLAKQFKNLSPSKISTLATDTKANQSTPQAASKTTPAK